jgi:hypothetical protein
MISWIQCVPPTSPSATPLAKTSLQRNPLRYYGPKTNPWNYNSMGCHSYEHEFNSDGLS